jgi:hypothetical protein
MVGSKDILRADAASAHDELAAYYPESRSVAEAGCLKIVISRPAGRWWNASSRFAPSAEPEAVAQNPA